MTPRAAIVLIGSLLAVQSCTRTVYVPVSAPQPASAPAPESRPPAPRTEPPRERPAPAPATAATLGIPPGHLPDPGECRIWIPGTPPGRQRSERSASCSGISQAAPAGSWIVYRPSRDRKLVHIRVTDRQRPGYILVVHVFEAESGKFLRDEPYDNRTSQPTTTSTRTEPTRTQPADPRSPPREQPTPTFDPGTDRPPIPVVPLPTNPQPGPEVIPGNERRQPTSTTPTTAPTTTPTPRTTPTTTPTTTPSPGPAVAPLDIPPGHLPNAGECRIWIPGTPPGRQPHRASAECDRITREAPAGSWVVYRPTADKKLIHVRVVDARRAGVIVAVRVFDETGKFVREERP